MKKLVLFLTVFTLVLSSCKAAKRTEAEIAADNIAYEKAVRAVNNRHFVIMADEVSVGMEPSDFAPRESLNFLYVLGDEGVVQFDSWFNLNGLGGITLKGRISGYEVSTDKKGCTRVSYSLRDNAVSGLVQFWIDKGSNLVRAQFIPDFISHCNVSIRGQVKPYNPNADGEEISVDTGSKIF
ncbi:MAG: DUF4251 domain-containing protein [Bacteroidaceae bacterium]|nr:DUF4251 domain-containing protein [Bacteroidaceae bacterium]